MTRPTHQTSVTADDLGLRYWPACSCGWSAYAAMSRTDALRLTRTHKRLMAPTRTSVTEQANPGGEA